MTFQCFLLGSFALYLQLGSFWYKFMQIYSKRLPPAICAIHSLFNLDTNSLLRLCLLKSFFLYKNYLLEIWFKEENILPYNFFFFFFFFFFCGEGGGLYIFVSFFPVSMDFTLVSLGNWNGRRNFVLYMINPVDWIILFIRSIWN